VGALVKLKLCPVGFGVHPETPPAACRHFSRTGASPPASDRGPVEENTLLPRDWDFWAQPIGNGPYRYVRAVPGTMMEFEANPHFYAGVPSTSPSLAPAPGPSHLTDAAHRGRSGATQIFGGDFVGRWLEWNGFEEALREWRSASGHTATATH